MPTEARSYTGPNATYKLTTNNGGVVATSEEERGPAYKGSMSRNSLSTLGYGEKVRTGSLPENTFSFTESFQTALLGYTWVTQKPVNTVMTSLAEGWFNWGSSFVPPVRISSAIVLNQRNLVIARMLDKIRDSDVDLSVMAGEARETARMYVAIARNVNLAIKAARKGRFGEAARALGVKRSAKSPANGWLLLNYGIVPHIRDLQGSVKALEKGLMKERYCLVSARDSYSDSYTRKSSRVTETWSMKSDVSARVKYQVSSPYTATLAALGLTNPFTTAWELTRLSFVVDWLIGIGGWLGQLDAYFGKKFVSGSVTTFQKYDGNGRVYYNGKYGTTGWEITNQSIEGWEVSCTRSALTTFPVMWLPPIMDPVSLSHVATATSLLVQLRRT